MTPRNKINLSLIIFSILSICLIVFIIYSLFDGIKKNSESLISQKAASVSFGAKIKELEEFQTVYQDLKPNLEKIDALFIDSKVPVEFINFLETTSQEYQNLIKISPGLPLKTERDPWLSIVFQITSTGSFPNFLRFLAKIETSPYLIEVQNLNVKRLTEKALMSKAPNQGLAEGSLGDVEATLLIKVYAK